MCARLKNSYLFASLGVFFARVYQVSLTELTSALTKMAKPVLPNASPARSRSKNTKLCQYSNFCPIGRGCPDATERNGSHARLPVWCRRLACDPGQLGRLHHTATVRGHEVNAGDIIESIRQNSLERFSIACTRKSH